MDKEVKRLTRGHYWHTDLANGIKDALSRCERTRVAVHSNAQAELGKIAAHRMAAQSVQDQNPELITFELIPEEEQEIYYIGAILV